MIKICGNKYPTESQKVASYQPDLMGWVFAPRSPRRVYFGGIESQLYDIKERYPRIRHVAVFAENSFRDVLEVAEQKLFDYLQIAAESSWLGKMQRLLLKKDLNPRQAQILPALRVQRPLDTNDLLAYERSALFVLDSFVAGQPGGTGKVLDLSFIKEMERAYLLAGGLNPENVKEALLSCRACGVDVSSGVEAEKAGRKDERKLKLFIENVRKLTPHNRVIRITGSENE